MPAGLKVNLEKHSLTKIKGLEVSIWLLGSLLVWARPICFLYNQPIQI